MSCEVCGSILVTGIEQKIRTCVLCAEKIISEVSDLRNQNQKLRDENLALDVKINKYLEAVSLQGRILKAQKEGGEAYGRRASLDDNPYNPDSDEAGSWSYGWLVANVISQAGKAQSIMTWSLGMMSVIHELARGGASGDELAAKISDVVEKMAPFIEESEE